VQLISLQLLVRINDLINDGEFAMKVSVFGLGYIGTVTAAALARAGHDVTGVDINEKKIELVNSGKYPIYEVRMDELIEEGTTEGRLKATFDARNALLESGVSIISVGTPASEDGSLDTTYLRRVCTKLGQVFANKDGFHTFVVRTTVLPGMTEDIVIPTIEEHSGKKVFIDFDVCVNPHFLRIGSLVDDYYNPPFTLIGEQEGSAAGGNIAGLYGDIEAPVVRTSLRGAEVVKYVSDSFHALKICFANEIGTLCKRAGIDSDEIMEIFKMDERLNLSGSYLMPGFSFGGPSVSSNIRALLNLAGESGMSLPLLSSIIDSNSKHIERAYRMIKDSGGKRIGFYGLAFKPGTDELRDSPLVRLAEMLLGDNYEMLFHDKMISPSRLVDANESFIRERIPGFEKMLAGSFDELYAWSDVLVIGHTTDELEYLISMDSDKIVIDLVRIAKDLSDAGDNYRGICW